MSSDADLARDFLIEAVERWEHGPPYSVVKKKNGTVRSYPVSGATMLLGVAIAAVTYVKALRDERV